MVCSCYPSWFEACEADSCVCTTALVCEDISELIRNARGSQRPEAEAIERFHGRHNVDISIYLCYVFAYFYVHSFHHSMMFRVLKTCRAATFNDPMPSGLGGSL